MGASAEQLPPDHRCQRRFTPAGFSPISTSQTSVSHSASSPNCSITPDTSLRRGKLFGQSDTYWLNLQQHYDIEVARETAGLSRVQVPAS